MNGVVQVFKMVIVVVGPIEVLLLFGKLLVVELKLYGIQVKLTSAVAGRIARLIFFLILVLTVLLFCAI